MTARVYVETSVVSYLTSRPSKNVVIAAHQQLTRRWWRSRDQYRVVISQAVLDEAAGGDPTERARRLRRLRGLPVLPLTDDATKLAGELVRRGALPQNAMVDALHIAIAATHDVEFLLTWNCKHMANAAMRGTIESICRAADRQPPVICTPEELFPRTFL